MGKLQQHPPPQLIPTVGENCNNESLTFSSIVRKKLIETLGHAHFHAPPVEYLPVVANQGLNLPPQGAGNTLKSPSGHAGNCTYFTNLLFSPEPRETSSTPTVEPASPVHGPFPFSSCSCPYNKGQLAYTQAPERFGTHCAVLCSSTPWPGHLFHSAAAS